MATERTVLVRLKAEPSDYIRGMIAATAATKTLMSQVDKTNDRTAWLAQGLLAIGPTLAPLGAAAVPAVAGLATGIGVAAAAAGVAALAFVGVGDALGALNDYQLEPTAAHFAKLQEEMEKMGPAGRDFIYSLDAMQQKLMVLKDTARENMFPGVTEGLQAMMQRLPQVNYIVGQLAEAMGNLTAEGGKSLAGPRFNEFFEYLSNRARPILEDMGHTLGNFIAGLADMVVAFDPLTKRFSSGFLQMSRDFAAWADGLEQSTSFQDFIEYVQHSLPMVSDFIGSVVDALVQLTEAAAPVGDIMLPALTQILRVFAELADTPLGSIFLGLAAAMSIYGRAAALASITTGGMLGTFTKTSVANAKAAASFGPLSKNLSVVTRNYLTAGAASERMAAQNAVASAQLKTQAARIAGTATQIGIFALAATGAADSMGLSNTATLALAGSLAGPLAGAAGAAAGFLIDLGKANNDFEDSTRAISKVIETGSLKEMKKQLEEVQANWDRLAHDNSLGANLERLSIAFGSMFGEDEIAKQRSEIDRLRSAINRAGESGGGLGRVLAGDLVRNLGLTGSALDHATASAKAFRLSVAAANRALEGRSSFRDYQQALDDFAAGLKDAEKKQKHFLNATKTGFNDNKQIGRDMEALLDNIANTSLKYAETMTGMSRVRYLEGARKDFIAAARAAGISRAAARALADQFGLLNQINARPGVDPQGFPQTQQWIDKTHSGFNMLDRLAAHPSVKVEGFTAAIFGIRSLQTAINNLHGTSVTNTVHTNYTSGGHPVKEAQGGYIRGPGTTTSDSIPALLSDREYVVRAAAVDKYGVDMLHAINDMRFAQGGYVGALPSAPTVQVSTGPLSAVARLHPDDIRLIAREIGSEVYTGARDGVVGKQRAVTAARRAG